MKLKNILFTELKEGTFRNVSKDDLLFVGFDQKHDVYLYTKFGTKKYKDICVNAGLRELKAYMRKKTKLQVVEIADNYIICCVNAD